MVTYEWALSEKKVHAQGQDCETADAGKAGITA